MSRLDDLVGSARAASPSWDDERAGRVLARTFAERDGRARKQRIARRIVAGASAAAIAVLVLFRATSPAGASAPGVSASVDPDPAPMTANANAIARVQDDGGYLRHD
jgi:hypothetical protein